MKSTTAIKTRVETKTESAAGIDTLSKGSIALMAGVSGTIGVWAVLCFAGALFSEGPAGLLKGALTAITGL